MGGWDRKDVPFTAAPMPEAMSVPARSMPTYGDPIDPVRNAAREERPAQSVMVSAPGPRAAGATANLTPGQPPQSGESSTFASLWAFVTRDPFPEGKRTVAVVQAPVAALLRDAVSAGAASVAAPSAETSELPETVQAGLVTPPFESRPAPRRSRVRRSGHRLEDDPPRPADPFYGSLPLQAMVLVAFLYLFFISPMPYALGWTNRKPS